MNKSEVIRSYITSNREKMKRKDLCKKISEVFKVNIAMARDYVRIYEDGIKAEERELLIIKEVDTAMKNRELKLQAIKRLSAKYNVPLKELDYMWVDLRLKQYVNGR